MRGQAGGCGRERNRRAGAKWARLRAAGRESVRLAELVRGRWRTVADAAVVLDDGTRCRLEEGAYIEPDGFTEDARAVGEMLERATGEDGQVRDAL